MRYLAFIDILGFRALIERTTESMAAYNRIYEALTSIHITNKRHQVHSSDGLALQSSPGSHEARTYTFSDHIVLVSPPTHVGMVYLLREIHSLYGQLLCNSEVCLRGAIVKGLIADDLQVVFGPALVKAYELESNTAVTPRILIDNNIAETYLKNLSKRHPETGRSRWHGATQITKDEDGLYFVDILATAPICNMRTSRRQKVWRPPTLPLWRSIVRKFIVTNLQHKHGKRTHEKYEWLAKYFNRKHLEFPLKDIHPIEEGSICTSA